MIPWYQSKSVWLNVATALVLVLVLFAPGSQFADLISTTASRWLELVVAVINIVLRVFFTNTTIRNPFTRSKG